MNVSRPSPSMALVTMTGEGLHTDMGAAKYGDGSHLSGQLFRVKLQSCSPGLTGSSHHGNSDTQRLRSAPAFHFVPLLGVRRPPRLPAGCEKRGSLFARWCCDTPHPLMFTRHTDCEMWQSLAIMCFLYLVLKVRHASCWHLDTVGLCTASLVWIKIQTVHKNRIICELDGHLCFHALVFPT